MYTEVAIFRKYETHAASVKDHSDYLAGARMEADSAIRGSSAIKIIKKLWN